MKYEIVHDELRLSRGGFKKSPYFSVTLLRAWSPFHFCGSKMITSPQLAGELESCDTSGKGQSIWLCLSEMIELYIFFFMT